MSAQEVFRCAYCGTLVTLHQAEICWTWADTLADGRELFVPAVYCSRYCGAQHSRGAVGRG